MSREAPYITLEAECALDSRWTSELFFAFLRLLSQCRLKRACTAETWPAAVLRLRNHEAAAILAVYPNKVRSTLDRLAMVASISVRSEPDHGGNLWTVSVDNYAKYQKLGRRSLAGRSADLSDPPHVPTSPRPFVEEEERRPAPPAARREDPAPSSRKRATPRIERPEGFPSTALLAELGVEFPDLELPAAVAEFLAYADREEATYKGERGWAQALRGALLRDRSRGLFSRRGPARAAARRPAPGGNGRPAYPAAVWDRELAELERPETHETAPLAAQGRLLA